MARVTARAAVALALSLAAFVTLAAAQECNCTGLDYTDGGSYLIDGNSQNQFTFNSVFYGQPQPFLSRPW